MQVTYLDKTIECENSQEALEQLFIELEDVVSSNNLVIDYMVIDGYEVYENYYEYLLYNVNNINRIDVRLITILQMFHQMLGSAVNYLGRALPEFDSLADQFYKGPTSDTWNKFEQLVEGLEWIIQVMKHITSQSTNVINKPDLEQFKLFDHSLQKKIGDLNDSLEAKDMVLIGDYLLYEIQPELKNAYGLLLNFIENEDMQNEHN